MKVGIVTLIGNNYGGMLQAYALNTVLKNEKCNVEVLNYNNLNRNEKNIKNTIKKIVYLKKNKKFDEFRRKYIDMTNKIYDISEYKNKYDAYIAGSDQIWNQQIPWEQRKYFFLDFVEGKKKVAYAASIGRNKIEEKEKKKISYLLEKFDDISIREKTGVSLYQPLTSKKIENVLDPTLLLTRKEWDKIARSTRGKYNDYVFSYTLGASKDVIKKIDELSKVLKKRIIEISYKKNYKNEEKNVNDAGPSEFVGLMKNSSYVLTNSFHGMVFAIIYGKQFLVFTRGNMNSRIFDLLEILDLRDRVIDLEKDSDIEIEKKMNTKIDYNEVYKILDQEKQKALKFLEKALDLDIKE